MEQEQVTGENKQLTPEDLDKIDNLLKEAFDAPWWRHYITMVKNRRNGMLEALCNSNLEQRKEDRLRGEISNCSWTLLIDEAGRQLNDPVFQEKLTQNRRERNGRTERASW